MDTSIHVIRPVGSFTVHEIAAMAQAAAHRGESLEQANPFKDDIAKVMFEAAFKQHKPGQ